MILTTFWTYINSIQHITIYSYLFCLSIFSVDKIKASQLGNWQLLFPTHPPLVFLHFIVLACFSISLDKSLMIFLIYEVLDSFGKCFSHIWGFIIFSKTIFLSLMSCLQYNSILPMRDVLFIYITIHHYSVEGYNPIFISSFMWFNFYSSLYFSCLCLWEWS